MRINDLDPANSFREELFKEIKKRKKWEGWDFKFAHFFLWLSIIASFSSAIIIAAGDTDIPKIWIAIIAGIPGLVVVIEKTFDFARRTAWDTMYKIDMQELQDDLSFGKIDEYQAAKKLREISRKHETSFLGIGFFARDKDKPAGDRPEDNDTNDNLGDENGNDGKDSINSKPKETDKEAEGTIK